MTRAVAIGECMVELSLAGSDAASVGYAGDTFNTAVYLSRLGLEVAYATALGADDPFSAGILRLMAEEGIDDSLVVRARGRLPGLYAISQGASGAPRFDYWRAEAPVRDYFRLADEAGLSPALLRALRQAQLVYISGVTLAVVGEAGRTQLFALLAAATHAGAAVALDVNYRPRLWGSAEAARTAMTRAAAFARYVSLSEDDRNGLGGWRPPDEAEVVERLADRTVRVRFEDGVLDIRPGAGRFQAVDPTGAGDAFNAAYLAARLEGDSPTRAVAAGRRLAEAVVSRRGAIIPKSETPGLAC